jgi:hypothetical protein
MTFPKYTLGTRGKKLGSKGDGVIKDNLGTGKISAGMPGGNQKMEAVAKQPLETP